MTLDSCFQSVRTSAASNLRRNPRRWAVTAAVLLAIFVGAGGAVGFSGIFNLQPFLDPTGVVATFNTNGNIDTTNAFFQSLGTNGRSCATCHQAGDAFGLSAAHAAARFRNSGGTDPLFASVDGANCPTATTVDAASRSLLINHGLIRIGMTVPANAQFQINVVHDPYGCAMFTDPATGQMTVSVYRRPLPTTNLNFLSTVMFDGRETVSRLDIANTFPANLVTDLTHQAMDATNGHAQASPPFQIDDPRLPQIVSLELRFSSAQVFDNPAGYLAARGAQGGPFHLSQQQYHPGINDSLGHDPSFAPFNPSAFSIFAPWQNLNGGQDDQGQDNVTLARQAIAAGEQLFNTRPLTISNVRGLDDNPALGNPVSFLGTCTTCHDTPNVGNHSFPLPLDIGTSHAAAYESDPNISAALAQLSFPDVPVYQITGCPNPFNGNQPESFYTTDPGKALVSGFCSDFNRGKGPILRGLAARAPYFHNGAAKDLHEIVNFYDKRFQMNLTDREKAELIAFLNSL